MKRILVTLVALLLGVTLSAGPLGAREASRHIGERAVVCGVVAGSYYGRRIRGSPTFLNLDAPYPHQPFTVLIWGRDRHRFGAPERKLRGRRICVRGRIDSYRGKPQIVLRTPSQLIQE